MKIISKYKDYYDYLQGIYGVDPKLVLDRRNFHNYELHGTPRKIELCICGIVYEGWFDGTKVHYGKELTKFGKYRKYVSWNSDNESRREVEIDNGCNRWNWDDVATVPYNDPYKLNERDETPILIKHDERIDVCYPNLSKLNFAKVIPAEEMFIKLSDWLSQQITKSESVTDTRTEHQRIESRGFDKKRSFRPKMKK